MGTVWENHRRSLGRETFELTPVENQSLQTVESLSSSTVENLSLTFAALPRMHSEPAAPPELGLSHGSQESWDGGRWGWLGKMTTSGARQVLARCH